MIRITFSHLVAALLTGTLLALALWCWLVLHYFTVPEPQWLSLLQSLHAGLGPQLRAPTLGALTVGYGLPLFLLYLFNDGQPSDRARVLRGARLVDAEKLANRTRLKKRSGVATQVTIAGVPIPQGCESGHFLLAGSTGTGKTVAADELLAGAVSRGDRCIVVDPDGHALARFGRKGDVVLNPFDERCPGWSVFNEIGEKYDFDRLAASMVPDAADASSQHWHAYARTLLAETMRAMLLVGEASTEQLLHWSRQASAAELGVFLAGTAASVQFEPGNEKALAGTRFILSEHLGCFQHLRPGDFSLSTWLESGKGNLYLTWREDMLPTLKPLMSGWVDILIAGVLSLPESDAVPLWLVLDELASLKRLNTLEDGLTKGRKHGLRVIAGLQSVAQLDRLYGVHSATTLRSCFRNLLALGCSNADPETAKVISEGLGESEVERDQVTKSSSHGRAEAGTSRSKQRTVEPLVLPSQLMGLAPLSGYLKISGDFPVAKVRLQPADREVRVKPFIKRRPC